MRDNKTNLNKAMNGYKEMEKGAENNEENEEKPMDQKEGHKGKPKKSGEMTKQELVEKLHSAEKEAQKHYDMYTRAYAEMENVKKRSRKEKEEFVKYANESLIKEILSVIDNLENAISHARDGENQAGIAEGLEMTLSGLMNILQKAGLEEIEADGKPFDPNYHEAMSQLQSDEMPPGYVAKELQKGYTLNGRLLRPSKVLVSSGGQEDDRQDTEK